MTPTQFKRESQRQKVDEQKLPHPPAFSFLGPKGVTQSSGRFQTCLFSEDAPKSLYWKESGLASSALRHLHKTHSFEKKKLHCHFVQVMQRINS